MELQVKITTHPEGGYRVDSRGPYGGGLMGHPWSHLGDFDTKEAVADAIEEEIDHQNRHQDD